MGGVRRVIHADGPVLVFGGPYGNLQATAAVLDEARARGIDADRVICTGDLAAYCANPSETIDIVRASGIHVVAGNCDHFIDRHAVRADHHYAIRVRVLLSTHARPPS